MCSVTSRLDRLAGGMSLADICEVFELFLTHGYARIPPVMGPDELSGPIHLPMSSGVLDDPATVVHDTDTGVPIYGNGDASASRSLEPPDDRAGRLCCLYSIPYTAAYDSIECAIRKPQEQLSIAVYPQPYMSTVKRAGGAYVADRFVFGVDKGSHIERFAGRRPVEAVLLILRRVCTHSGPIVRRPCWLSIVAHVSPHTHFSSCGWRVTRCSPASTPRKRVSWGEPVWLTTAVHPAAG